MGIHILTQAVAAAIHHDCHLKLQLLEFWQATFPLLHILTQAVTAAIHCDFHIKLQLLGFWQAATL